MKTIFVIGSRKNHDLFLVVTLDGPDLARWGHGLGDATHWNDRTGAENELARLGLRHHDTNQMRIRVFEIREVTG